MPKMIQYKANSVVYFAGDFDERVFLLHDGRIALTSNDIQTGGQVTELIKQGEFFGVKSALGNFPREEDAMVLKDSTVYSFSRQEFENFAQKNTRIILKMIKVFSRQLRTVHRHLESMLDSKQETNAEEGLFGVINAFYNSQHLSTAFQIAKRYEALYPQGKYAIDVGNIIRLTEGAADAVVSQSLPQQTSQPAGRMPLAIAEELVQKQDWNNAYRQYHTVIESGLPDAEIAYVGAGQCLYETKEYVRCLKLLTQFISQYPKSLKLAEVLMYMGKTYQAMGHPDKAGSFYDKAISLAGPLLVPKIKELRSSCGGD